MIIRRYHAILLGAGLLLTGAVSHSSYEPYRFRLQRPLIGELPKRPWMALTFDDGPHPVMTEKLLNQLKAQGVPATFFIVGKMALRHPRILQEIARQGHEIANHTFSHPTITHLKTEAVINELAQTRRVIHDLTGRDTLLYRPPGGIYSRRTVKAASKAGYHMILWTILTKDVNGASVAAMQGKILNRASDGGIILMHSGIPNTIEMLPQVITQLREQGYNFVTVSQLLGFDHSSGKDLQPLPISSDNSLVLR